MSEFCICIYDKVIKIKNRVNEFDERINQLLKSFPYVCDEKIYASLVLRKNLAIMKSKRLYKKIRANFCNRDLFNLFYQFLYEVFASEKSSFIHSVAVSKNNDGVLILGDFGSGKTTLAHTFENYGYKINSGDQSLIEIKDEELQFCFGSLKDKNKGEISYLRKEDGKRLFEIKKIIFCIGVSDNGNVQVSKIEDKVRMVKKLWNCITWPYTQPMIETDKDLKIIIPKSYYKFLKHLSVLELEYFEVRGDCKKIAKELIKV